MNKSDENRFVFSLFIGICFLCITLFIWRTLDQEGFDDFFVHGYIRSLVHYDCLQVSDDFKEMSLKVTEGCTADFCKIEKTWYFVRDNMRYINQTEYDEIISPEEVYKILEGDCDDYRTLGYCILYYNEIKTRIEFSPKHTYLSLKFNGTICEFDTVPGCLNSPDFSDERCTKFSEGFMCFN